MPKIRFFTQADNLPSKPQKELARPKEKYRLTNWKEFDKALINRGFVTLWLDEGTPVVRGFPKGDSVLKINSRPGRRSCVTASKL